jgi:MFS family permease
VTPSLIAAAVASVASGLAGFAVTAVVGDVAATFGAPGAGEAISDQIGLTGTTLGVALATIRLASLGSLPASALADRVGRRATLLGALAVGLAMTALGALAPGFWWWVAAVAVARPFLSTVNNLSGVVAAEETLARYRSWALASIGAAYGIGAGVVPVLRGIMPDASYRLVIGLVLVPLLAVPLLGRVLHEPAVYERAADAPTSRRARVLGTVPPAHRRRLALLLLTTGALALATGPGFTYVVVYAEQILGASTSTTAALVLAAGPIGGAGLLTGRWLADRVGRRPAAAGALVVTAAGLATAYTGSLPLLVLGYLVAISAAAAFGTPAGALAAEAFPTTIRATVAGWVAASGVVGAVAGLAAFGVLADVTGGFAGSARILAVVVALGAVPLVGVPETLGWELDGDLGTTTDGDPSD